ncbi:Protein AEXR-1 [Aphelenchoides avenae]|nr:Protein AEXR-1 [Aphelenchus avenae]
MSGIFLTVINFDRYLFFGWPMQYILLRKRYAVGVSVTALWLSKATFIVNTCTSAFSHGGIYPYIAFIITTCVLPIISSAALSLYLYVMTNRRRRTLPASSPNRNSRQKINTLLFLFTTTVWTTVSLLPSRTMLTWLFLASPQCPSDVVFWLASVANLATRLYPTVNPIITGLLCAPYTRELVQIYNEIKSFVLSKE